MREVVIVSGVRTPVGRQGGVLKDVEACELVAIVLNALIE